MCTCVVCLVPLSLCRVYCVCVVCRVYCVCVFVSCVLCLSLCVVCRLSVSLCLVCCVCVFVSCILCLCLCVVCRVSVFCVVCSVSKSLCLVSCVHHRKENNLWRVHIALGGADFEIIPTNNILPAHHLWAGSLHFPPRAGCFFHGRQVRPEKSEATQAIPWCQDRARYAPLRSRCCCWWARQWRIMAIISLHCLSEIGTLSQNRYWFWRRKLAQLLYLGVSPFCTRCRGVVLKPQSLPHRVHWCTQDIVLCTSSPGKHPQQHWHNAKLNSWYWQLVYIPDTGMVSGFFWIFLFLYQGHTFTENRQNTRHRQQIRFVPLLYTIVLHPTI